MNPTVSHSLLANAVDSIRVGIEDAGVPNKARWVSAVRNLHAGILLLYKEKLRRMSPPGSEDALLKKNLVPALLPDGSVIFKGTGKVTVDTQGIQERLTALGVKVDWSALRQITSMRNDMEHLFSTASEKLVNEVIAKSYILIRDFMREALHERPLDLLGSKVWNKMLELSEVYELEKESCSENIKGHPWINEAVMSCAVSACCCFCGSGLLEPETHDCESDLVCCSCGETTAYQIFAERCGRCGHWLHSNENCNDGLCIYCRYVVRGVLPE